jgi:4-hydroxy-tetrahydrodipicolinate synthase
MRTRPIDLNRLATVQVVPMTPFTPDGWQLVTQQLRDLARDLYQAGIRVFLPGAGTGEFHSLTVPEVLSTVQVTRQAIGADGLVMAPVGLGLGHALALGRGAVEAGADALLVMPPIHSYLSDAGFRDYIQVLADELPLPLFAYKKGPVPSDALLLELCAAGRLAGIKYAVNDVDAVTRFARALDPRAGLYCGTAERFAPFFLLAGAKGFTSGAANLCPRLSLAMCAALQRGDATEAMRLLDILRPIEDFRARAGDSFNISMLKSAIRLVGRDFGPPRPPMRRLTPAEEAEVRTVVEPILAAERAMR